MNINVDDIFEFYEMRIKCHVTSVNYFAELLGYHFPEHDGDKIIEPIRTGYACMFYRTYHKNFCPTQQQIELSRDAEKIHHTHAPHHIEHYQNVNEIPDIYLYEILSDWASADFEEKYIINRKSYIPLKPWFDKNMSHLPWTEHQLEIIKKSFQIFAENTDTEILKAIWQPLLEKSDL